MARDKKNVPGKRKVDFPSMGGSYLADGKTLVKDEAEKPASTETKTTKRGK